MKDFDEVWVNLKEYVHGLQSSDKIRQLAQQSEMRAQQRYDEQQHALVSLRADARAMIDLAERILRVVESVTKDQP